MRFGFFTAPTILVMILVVACTPLPQQPEQAEPVPQPEVDRLSEGDLPEQAEPVPQPEVAPQLPEPEVAHPALQPEAVEPDSLIGIDQDSLIKQFGTPDYERLEGSIRILQYRLAPCVLDFVVNHHTITAWAARHRQYGKDYNHHACSRALAQIKH